MGARTFEECGAAGQHDVGEERSPQVHVRFLNGEDQHLVEPFAFLSDQVRPEQQLRGSETGRANLQPTPGNKASQFNSVPRVPRFGAS